MLLIAIIIGLLIGQYVKITISPEAIGVLHSAASMLGNFGGRLGIWADQWVITNLRSLNTFEAIGELDEPTKSTPAPKPTIRGGQAKVQA